MNNELNRKEMKLLHVIFFQLLNLNWIQNRLCLCYGTIEIVEVIIIIIIIITE